MNQEELNKTKTIIVQDDDGFEYEIPEDIHAEFSTDLLDENPIEFEKMWGKYKID